MCGKPLISSRAEWAGKECSPVFALSGAEPVLLPVPKEHIGVIAVMHQGYEAIRVLMASWPVVIGVGICAPLGKDLDGARLVASPHKAIGLMSLERRLVHRWGVDADLGLNLASAPLSCRWTLRWLSLV